MQDGRHTRGEKLHVTSENHCVECVQSKKISPFFYNYFSQEKIKHAVQIMKKIKLCNISVLCLRTSSNLRNKQKQTEQCRIYACVRVCALFGNVLENITKKQNLENRNENAGEKFCLCQSNKYPLIWFEFRNIIHNVDSILQYFTLKKSTIPELHEK